MYNKLYSVGHVTACKWYVTLVYCILYSTTTDDLHVSVYYVMFRGRDRFVDEEFDLDLTYITERIIAMSFPATGMQSAYRNSLKDVAKMLKTKHQESYMVSTVLIISL